MGDAKKREFVLGISMLIMGLGYLLITSQLPRKQTIDATFVPYALGSILCVLGLFQMRAAAKLVANRAAVKKVGSADYVTVGKTVGLIVVYVALMDAVGFPIMTALYLYAQFLVLTPASRKPRYVLYGMVAVVSSAVIYVTFRYALDLMLPVGLLNQVGL